MTVVKEEVVEVRKEGRKEVGGGEWKKVNKKVSK